MIKIIIIALRILLVPIAFILSPFFSLIARTGVGISITRNFGFHPLRVHYYQPVPEYESVPDEFFIKKQKFPGFDMNIERVKETLEKLSGYAIECSWPEAKGRDGIYYSQNPSFGYSSAAILHAMIRSYSSKGVVEIGGGFSSLIALEALRKNSDNGNFSFKCIEPFPSEWLKDLAQESPDNIKLYIERAEKMDIEAYLDLKENDVLFIDSSHVSKLNSDVNYIYLQVLPRLAKGVIVHIHDIYIPYEYPRVHFYGLHKYFWNEQYMLQAFLTNNNDFEIILPGYYVQTDMRDDFQRVFPHYDPAIHRATSSLWLKKKQ
jgi:hypothetical protein